MNVRRPPPFNVWEVVVVHFVGGPFTDTERRLALTYWAEGVPPVPCGKILAISRQHGRNRIT